MNSHYKYKNRVTYNDIVEEKLKDKTSKDIYTEISQIMFKQIDIFEKEKKKVSTPKIRMLTNLPSGTIEAKLLGDMINGLQSTLDGAFNFVQGNGSNAGKIPYKFRKNSALLVNSFEPGSFIVSFDSLNSEKGFVQGDLFEEDFSVLELVDDLFMQIDLINDYESIYGFISKYGSRAFERSKKWISDIKEGPFEYSNQRKKVHINFSEARLKDISQIMDRISLSKKETSISIKGKLVMADNNKSKICLLCDDKEYLIHVKDDSLDKLKISTNEVYTISVKKITTLDSFGKETIEYYIDTLRESDLDKNNRV